MFENSDHDNHIDPSDAAPRMPDDAGVLATDLAARHDQAVSRADTGVKAAGLVVAHQLIPFKVEHSARNLGAAEAAARILTVARGIARVIGGRLNPRSYEARREETLHEYVSEKSRRPDREAPLRGGTIGRRIAEKRDQVIQRALKTKSPIR